MHSHSKPAVSFVIRHSCFIRSGEKCTCRVLLWLGGEYPRGNTTLLLKYCQPIIPIDCSYWNCYSILCGQEQSRSRDRFFSSSASVIIWEGDRCFPSSGMAWPTPACGRPAQAHKVKQHCMKKKNSYTLRPKNTKGVRMKINSLSLTCFRCVFTSVVLYSVRLFGRFMAIWFFLSFAAYDSPSAKQWS